ncbi:MAG: hypothetical protein ACLQVA_06385 [Candidatus Brocadiia bacterium]
MSDAGVASIAEKKKVAAWAIIGGALLAMYLPPVFAIAVLNRWTDVSRRLRTAAIVLSFFAPASFALWIALEKSPWRPLAYPLFAYTPILMLVWCV